MKKSVRTKVITTILLLLLTTNSLFCEYYAVSCYAGQAGWCFDPWAKYYLCSR